MKKRLVSCILAISMCASICTPAFASNSMDADLFEKNTIIGEESLALVDGEDGYLLTTTDYENGDILFVITNKGEVVEATYVDTIIVCGGAFRLRSFFVKAENVCKRMEPPAHHRLPRCRPENSGPETLRRGEAGSCPEPWLGFLRRCLGRFPAATPQGRQVLPCSRHPPDTMRKGRPQRGEFRKGLPEPKAAAIILFAAVCG